MASSQITPLIESMIRVNQAGEYGAKRIYEGQLSLDLPEEEKRLIEEMKAHEEEHLLLFNRLSEHYSITPTKLTPLWDIAGFGLGTLSALLGKRAMMACTVAVEEVIDDHYQAQLKKLQSIREDYEPELQALIKKCHQEELVHRDIGLAHQAEEMFGFTFFKSALKIGVRVAIEISKRI